MTTAPISATTIEGTAWSLVQDGKGLLAADETPHTLGKRLQAVGIESTPDTRRDYREMLFSTPGVADHISGVILQDETIHQNSAAGEPLVSLLLRAGVIPGIKVDAGVTPLAGPPGEFVTEGLDGLRDRLQMYSDLGARFHPLLHHAELGLQLPELLRVGAVLHRRANLSAARPRARRPQSLSTTRRDFQSLPHGGLFEIRNATNRGPTGATASGRRKPRPPTPAP